jgi:hypothetical protein
MAIKIKYIKYFIIKKADLYNTNSYIHFALINKDTKILILN